MVEKEVAEEATNVPAARAVETADRSDASERAAFGTSHRLPFVAREHIAPEPGHQAHQRQPGEVIQADGTQEPDIDASDLERRDDGSVTPREGA